MKQIDGWLISCEHTTWLERGYGKDVSGDWSYQGYTIVKGQESWGLKYNDWRRQNGDCALEIVKQLSKIYAS